MSERPPTQPPPGGSRRVQSVVIVNTGQGKGKSTAAFGSVMRAAARDWRIAVVQFVKSGKWKVGEEKTAKSLGVEWWTIGEGFTWDSTELSRDEAVAKDAWSHAKSIIGRGEHQLVVLDEITYPINWGWIDGDDVISTIRTRPSRVNIVATGRDAPGSLTDIADTVTEMTNVKHVFDRGVKAMRGIDY